ncbi:hypothetical protein BT69DRAFT_1335211 [Atractiella rhizophila]|nr:hypothetical protein BT69DRAFT_1335211 [Atractiella rhizophila]
MPPPLGHSQTIISSAENSMTYTSSIKVSNLSANETIYQRFLLLHGTAGHSPNEKGYISISSANDFDLSFPVSSGHWKGLVPLLPGPQDLRFCFVPSLAPATSKAEAGVEKMDLDEAEGEDVLVLEGITYIPLLHIRPVHLAILVASDSSLLIDCPPEKLSSSVHSDLQAAIKKLRLWAYMSQALTAENMRAEGLGRRSFRLEEEWGRDTIFAEDGWEEAFRHTAKVHVVKSTYTMKQLRDPNWAQQNDGARQAGKLYDVFMEALDTYGGVFEGIAGRAAEKPVVAGLILDSHFDPKQNLIVAHAALGGGNNKRQLGMFGSHTSWAWPRHIEEIVPCLLDDTPVTARSKVGNDAGQCGTFWEACCIGQGAFLHELGHALGLPHQSEGIMRRGYVEWNRSFVSKEAHCKRTKSAGMEDTSGETTNKWHLFDLYTFRFHPCFRQPGDKTSSADLSVTAGADGGLVSCSAGIALLEYTVNDDRVRVDDLREQDVKEKTLPYEVLDDLPKDQRVTLKVMGKNGTIRTIGDLRDFLTSSFVRVNDKLTLMKKSARWDGHYSGKEWKWAVLLSKLGKEGKVIRANKIVIHVGAWFDGFYLHFEDGTVAICGPRFQPGSRRKHLGGNPQTLRIGKGDKVTGLKVKEDDYKDRICAVAIRTEQGEKVEHGISFDEDDVGDASQEVESLEPEEGYEIVGFFGKNQWDGGFDATNELGILTAPIGTVLPPEAYRMHQLRNYDGGLSKRELQGCNLDEKDTRDYEDSNETGSDGGDE